MHRKQKLYDGAHPVQRLNILMALRDAEETWRFTAKIFEKIEDRYALEINYIFVENSSEDETPELISSFLDARSAVLVRPCLPGAFENWSRPDRIGWARTQGFPFLDNEAVWTLIIDADVICEENILENLFSHGPSEKNIAMLCAYGLHAGMIFDKNNYLKEVVHVGHYYDTFSFIPNLTQDKLIFWPFCIFEECRQCAAETKIIAKPASNLVEVKAAFGGLALVKTDLISNGIAKFESLDQSQFRIVSRESSRMRQEAFAEFDEGCSEWIGFCENISNSQCGSICVATDCRVFWANESTAFVQVSEEGPKDGKISLQFGCFKATLDVTITQ
jgi:hypothetical protein